MNKNMGKLIRLLPQRTNDTESGETNIVPEGADYIQDHTEFENRRQQLINEYESQLKQLKNSSTQLI